MFKKIKLFQKKYFLEKFSFFQRMEIININFLFRLMEPNFSFLHYFFLRGLR